MWMQAEEERSRLVSLFQTCEGECVRVFQALACGVQAIFCLGVAGVEFIRKPMLQGPKISKKGANQV